MTERIYLDHNATTPLHPAVRVAIEEALGDGPANPSSPHAEGRTARRRIEDAREQLADYLGVDPGEIFFTSGGTESNNLAIHGLAKDAGVYCSAVEHPSVLEPCRAEWRSGRDGCELPVDGTGVPREVLATLPADTLLSLQWVNNETGIIHDLAEVAQWAHERGAVVHTDGAQGFFRLPGPLSELGVDAATITAHKSYGPVGVGALFLRRGSIIDPPFQGGPQERRARPGTENVPAIHGLGELARIARSESLWPLDELSGLRERFRGELEGIEGLTVMTPKEGSFPSVLQVSLPDLHAETVLMHLDRRGIAASSGSACSTGAQSPSHVLKALGRSDREIRGAIRFSFGRLNSEEQLARAARQLSEVVDELRGTS